MIINLALYYPDMLSWILHMLFHGTTGTHVTLSVNIDLFQSWPVFVVTHHKENLQITNCKSLVWPRLEIEPKYFRTRLTRGNHVPMGQTRRYQLKEVKFAWNASRFFYYTCHMYLGCTNVLLWVLLICTVKQ